MQALLLGMLLCLAACSHPQVNVHITADQRLNADSVRHALPVQLRLYQLTDAHAFQQAAFWQLWQHDQKVLANSAVAHQQLTIVPGDQQTVHLLRDTRAKYLGVMALFRHPNPKSWRQVAKSIGAIAVTE